MSTRNLIYTVRPALGGLDITSDPTILDPNFLTAADNIVYLEGGQRKRRPGLLQYSASSSTAGTATNVMISTGSVVRAISDSWDYSSGGLTPVQRLIAVTSRSLFRSTGNGAWTAITGTSSFNGGLQLQMNIMLGQDHAVISNGAMAPIAYNLAATTLVAATTGALWPVFESAVYHLNRMVMLGLSTAASTVRMTAADNIFDSTGTDSVTLPIDPGDGDRVMGAAQTFFRNLYVFKGPQFGSVHEITGNTSTSFSKNKIFSGAPAVSHKAIITTPTDIYWMSPYGIHSLQTTLKYGSVEQAFLSLPIQNMWRKRLIERSTFDNTCSFWDPNRNIVGWITAPAGSLASGGGMYWLLVYNYALSDPTPGGKKFWSIWKISRATGAGFGIRSAASVRSPSGIQTAYASDPRVYFGGDNGLVYQGGYQFFEDDGAPFTTQITTPIITRFKTPQGAIPETQEKQYTGFVTYFANSDSQIASAMDYNATVDNRPAGNGTLPVSIAGGILGSFIMGSGILGGISFEYSETIIEGRGRGIQLTWTNSNLDDDFEHLGYSIRFAAAEAEAKEAV